MSTLICTVGLPRSGKTTWARSTGYPIVNPDSIRLALHGERFLAQAEPMVWVIARIMVEALFKAGHERVVLDATNTTRKRRDVWRDLPGVRVLFRPVPTPVEECRRRAAGDTAILPVIDQMAERFEPLGEDEEQLCL